MSFPQTAGVYHVPPGSFPGRGAEKIASSPGFLCPVACPADLPTWPPRAQILQEEEWLRARGATPDIITASDVAPILGMGRGSAWEVWARKKGVPLPPPSPETEAAWERGHLLEGPTLEWYARQVGGEDLRVLYAEVKGEPYHFWMEGPEEWMKGTPDALVCGPGAQFGGVDAKTAGWTSSDWDLRSDAPSPPDHIQCQAWWYMLLTGAPWWDIACLHLDLQFRRYRIERDEAVIQAMVADVRAWRARYLLGDETPLVDGSAACSASLLHRARGKRTDDLRPATGEEGEIIERFLAARRAAKGAGADVDRLGNEVRALIGEAGGGLYLGGDSSRTVTWREQTAPSRIDLKRLREEAPDVAEKYTLTGEPTRVLRVAPKLEKA